MSITSSRIRAFCENILNNSPCEIGFVDVGSGGALKTPWNFLPDSALKKINFEPTQENSGNSFICISNDCLNKNFNVANDERSSSLHIPSPLFVERFGMHEMLTNRTINVQCITLDKYLAENYKAVDAVDINVEGHDYQVLQGANTLLTDGFVKLLKVEFELAQAWVGQGWFGDIELLMRKYEFDLVDISIDFARPVGVKNIHLRGEPVWGKAYFMPSLNLLKKNINLLPREDVRSAGFKYIALAISAGQPRRALDILSISGIPYSTEEMEKIKVDILNVYKYSRFDAGVNLLCKLVKGVTGFKG